MHTIDENNLKEFNKWAEIYDFPLNYLNFYTANKKLIEALNPRKRSSVLDVGFGTGILLEQLLQSNKELKLFGLDISNKMVAVAQKKFEGKNVQLSLGSALKMSYKDNSFDYITCVHSFHHHPDSLQSLTEMKRVVKKGGKVAILDNFLDGFLRMSFHELERKLFPVRESNIRRYTKEGIKQLFQKVGLKNIQQTLFLYFCLITIGEK